MSHPTPTHTAPLAEPLEGRRLMTVIAGFSESVVADGLNRPVQMAFAPDGRLFVTQQDGKLRVVKNGQLLATPFLTVPAHNTGERGLLGIEFDPNFASNKFLYVYYTRANGTGGYVNRVSRFTANGDAAVAGSEHVLIETDPLGAGTWHNAGALHFGPDGKLYVGVGENQQNQVAQSLNTLLGKVLRINPDGSIPADNPFYTQASGKNRAIYATGLRNPFTMDVQPGTGRFFVNDVGAARFEEINELQRGANYGWPSAEGPSTNPAFKNPFYSYAHVGGDFDDSAITGAAFYNPANHTFPADYAGDFFFGDYGLDTVKRIDVNTKQVGNFVSNVPEITDVEVGPDGAVYYTSRLNGRVYRAQATTSAAPTIAVHPQSQTVAAGQSVTFTVAANGANLNYQWQRNNANIPGATAASYTVSAATLADSGDTFRVIVSNSAGSVTSNPATLTVLDNDAPTATITSPTAGTLWTGGGSLTIAGTGTDPEDGTLPPGAFTWRVDLHHDAHAHPFVAPFTGKTSDTIAIPTAGHDAEHNIWYRVHLTVTDSVGTSHSTFRDVFPQKVNLSLRTEPAGLSLSLDGAPTAMPYDSPAVVGFQRSLAAPATQTLNGVVYAFDGWSDGTAAAARSVLVPGADVTYTARYKVSTQQSVTLAPIHDAHVRDGSYAGQNFGAAAEMQVKTDAVGWNRHAYLTFDLTGVGAGVSSAKLRLSARLDNTLSASVPVTVHASTGGWTESSLTWNSKPAAAAQALASFTPSGTSAKTYELDLTSYLAQQKAAGAASVTIVLKAAAAKSTVLVASGEAAAGAPQLLVVTGGGSNPGPGPTVLRATADAFVRSGSFGTNNFGASGELQVKQHSSADYSRETYLKFDLSTLTTVTSAKLRLHGRLTEAGTTQTGVFKAADTGWSEFGLTWNTRPFAGTTAAATATVSGTTSRWYEWDLTSLLQAEKAAGRSAVTLVLRSLSQTSGTLVFASDEAGANRPELVVG